MKSEHWLRGFTYPCGNQWEEGVALLGSVFSKTVKEWGLQDALRNLIQGHDWFLSAFLANLDTFINAWE